MPLPHRLAAFNTHVTNPFARHIAGWAPGFAIVQHVGRRSGRAYATPVNVFRRRGGYLFALTYGEGEWAKNVLAAGGCSIRARRHIVELTDPSRFTDTIRHDIPIPVRWILAALQVDQFLFLREA